MSSYLLTSLHLPSALDLVRNLARHGHRVIGADSMRFPFSRHTRYLSKFYHTRAPHKHWKEFRRELLDIVLSEDIDYIVPTCEEVIYVSRSKQFLEERAPGLEVICPEFDLVRAAHSKNEVLQLAEGCGIQLPRTETVSAAELLERAVNLVDHVVKPEFCRCGAEVLVNPDLETVQKLIDRTLESSLYLIQAKVRGVEYGTYGIAYKGTLRFHAIYRLVYRISGGPGVYFEPVNAPHIDSFAENFVSKHDYTGQFGFDIIDSDKPYLIECNPRTTSGIHFAAQTEDLATLLVNAGPLRVPEHTGPLMLGGGMMNAGLRAALSSGRFGEWRRHYTRARDVVLDRSDKRFRGYQLLTLCEVLIRALRHRISISNAVSYDLEWNGTPLDE